MPKMRYILEKAEKITVDLKRLKPPRCYSHLLQLRFGR